MILSAGLSRYPADTVIHESEKDYGYNNIEVLMGRRRRSDDDR